ncbi:MAG TPA: LysM peptidoglycan-binding domain-containing protein [Rhodocyclaceae bacterium]|nr:LysM peptidoglycan-binding domain-containing protein [Rhodocyclaceae bacterium]
MRHIISARLLALVLTAALVQVPAYAASKASKEPRPLELSSTAPDRHIVVPGDTLWGISAEFLKEPYRWPELWRMNADEIKNPHWIYPGQVLVLERDADGKPRLRVGGEASGGTVKLDPKIYVTPKKTAISAIPYAIIRPYLARPMVLDLDQLDALPRVVSAENDRVLLGAGDKIFAGGLTDRVITWHIYRPGAALKDPETGALLGYESLYVGSARLIAEGNPATLQVTRSAVEILRGDRLIAETPPAIISYVPHIPTFDITGRILTVYGAVGLGGQYSVVSISRGARDGIEIGHVLELSRAGRKVDERFNGVKTTYETPDQRTGLVFVFQVFDKVSYALVMAANDPIAVGDIVNTP